MKLSSLLKAIGRTLQTEDVEISLVTDDSRKCAPNSVFVCHPGGEAFVAQAKANGACAVIAETAVEDGCIQTDNSRVAYAELCSAFFSAPAKALRLVAVTGTNGKTTVASMLAHILALNGCDCGLLSTVTNGAALGEDMTTPDCFTLQRALRDMVNAGKRFCVLEASSQGLAQERLHGLRFEIGIFTNLSRDHLDYHKTFDAYCAAKARLFSQSDTAILNYDDPAWETMANAAVGRVLTYSTRKNEADFTAKDVRVTADALDFALVSDCLIHRVRLELQGEFNVENAMAAVIAAMQLGVPLESCCAALRTFSPVKGRMERVDITAPFQVVIDYAHTPDSLRRALLSLRRFCKGKLIVVFGCGGDRDSGKRPEMGRVAVNFADAAVVTSDNPRSEDAQAIIDDILTGVTGRKTPVFIQPDRAAAIAFAMQKARPGDVVLLAGKGHETTQTIENRLLTFDERDIVKNYAKGMF